MHNNYLMGLIFGTSRRVALTKKNSLWGYGFFKKGFKSNGFQVVVWSQNVSFFLFRISSQIWRFSPKLRYLRFFLFRISSQIWRFSQKLRFLYQLGRRSTAQDRELLYEGKSAQQLSYGFNILDKLECSPTKKKFLMGI